LGKFKFDIGLKSSPQGELEFVIIT
ncbi:MAG: hypothetical protein RL418_661, partial [Actinomycetota bacterium]